MHASHKKTRAHEGQTGASIGVFMINQQPKVWTDPAAASVLWSAFLLCG